MDVVIHWTSTERFTSHREVDLAEVMAWVNESPSGSPLTSTDDVNTDHIRDFLKAGDLKDLDLTAMSEGTDWRDRDDPILEDVEIRTYTLGGPRR